MVNGQNWLTLPAGTNTRSSTNNSASLVELRNSSPIYNIYSDFYILDDTGNTNNNFLGDIIVETLYPSGIGNYSQFVGSDGNSVNNYQLVDDPAFDGDTTFVETSGVGFIDTYTYTKLSKVPSVIYGIQQSIGCRKTDAGNRTIAGLIRVAGTDYLSNDPIVTDTYLLQGVVIETNPATSGAWSQADINSIEAGFKILS
jgi:hypothetical protein